MIPAAPTPRPWRRAAGRRAGQLVHAVRWAGPAILAAAALCTTGAGVAHASAALGPGGGTAAGTVPGTAPPQGPASAGLAELPGAAAPMVRPGPGQSTTSARQDVAPLGRLLTADVLVVSNSALPAGTAAAVARVHGVQAARAVDAAQIQLNGKFVPVLGVDPSTFRNFTPAPTATATALWRSVANGAIAVSYTMGQQDHLPVGSTVQVTGRTVAALQVGGYGTVGIGGVDAVVSDTVARSLGFPAGNAVVVSAPHAQIAAVISGIKARMPRGTLVEPLVTTTASGRPAAAGSVGSGAVPASSGSPASAGTAASLGGAGLSAAQIYAMVKAAESRLGLPYVWGAAGPASFDCSGLVQWSFAQAGVVMPRVAADQARTGPAVPFSQAQPGDLLFYHTDPTAPDYISHVAIYLGGGWMIQAPQPGQDVQVVRVDLGSEFAGVVRVDRSIADEVAASPVG